MPEKILIVDDQPEICEILAFNLSGEGFEVTCAHSAEEALGALMPDHGLILLDVMMGGMSGYQMAERLRREGNLVPVIFLTARDSENDLLTGFSVGGDDYIAKPFLVKEVLARVKAVLKRRPATEASSGTLTFGELSIDPALKETSIGEQRIPLTKTEFGILWLLASNPSKLFSREMLIDTLWIDTPYITERTVDVHITRLRKKLGPYGRLIGNRPGYGYRFDPSQGPAIADTQ